MMYANPLLIVTGYTHLQIYFKMYRDKEGIEFLPQTLFCRTRYLCNPMS